MESSVATRPSMSHPQQHQGHQSAPRQFKLRMRVSFGCFLVKRQHSTNNARFPLWESRAAQPSAANQLHEELNGVRRSLMRSVLGGAPVDLTMCYHRLSADWPLG